MKPPGRNAGELIELLLARGARCDVRESAHDATPAGFANHAGHIEIRDLLLDHTEDVFDLATYGRATQLRGILALDSSLATVRTSAGHTPIHAVRVGGSQGASIVDLLLEHGADINATDNDGSTPLSLALDRDDEDLATILRVRGAKSATGR